MAVPQSKKLTALDLATPLSNSDQLYLVQDGRSKRATVAQLRAVIDTSCECTLVSRYNEVGTDANTVAKHLHTYTLPEGVMSVDGNYLEIHAAGTFAANGNNKTVAIGIKQDSTGHNSLSTIPTFAFNDDYWMIDLRIQRSSASTYVRHRYMSVVDDSPTLQTPGVLHTVGSSSGINWDAGDVQITVVAQNGTASAGDITCNTFIIEAHLLDPNS